MYRCPNCACPVVSAGQSATHFKYKCWADCCPDIFEIEKENGSQSEPDVSEIECAPDPSERKVDNVT